MKALFWLLVIAPALFIMYTSGKPLFWFLVILTPIVFIHELGHFLFARLFGVKIEVFSIGFGKPLLKWRDSKDTVWQIALIPLGGYVRMYGDEGAASTPDKEKIDALSENEKKLILKYNKILIEKLHQETIDVSEEDTYEEIDDNDDDDENSEENSSLQNADSQAEVNSADNK